MTVIQFSSDAIPPSFSIISFSIILVLSLPFCSLQLLSFSMLLSNLETSYLFSLRSRFSTLLFLFLSLSLPDDNLSIFLSLVHHIHTLKIYSTFHSYCTWKRQVHKTLHKFHHKRLIDDLQSRILKWTYVYIFLQYLSLPYRRAKAKAAGTTGWKREASPSCSQEKDNSQLVDEDNPAAGEFSTSSCKNALYRTLPSAHHRLPHFAVRRYSSTSLRSPLNVLVYSKQPSGNFFFPRKFG